MVRVRGRIRVRVGGVSRVRGHGLGVDGVRNDGWSGDEKRFSH